MNVILGVINAVATGIWVTKIVLVIISGGNFWWTVTDSSTEAAPGAVRLTLFPDSE